MWIHLNTNHIFRSLKNINRWINISAINSVINTNLEFKIKKPLCHNRSLTKLDPKTPRTNKRHTARNLPNPRRFTRAKAIESLASCLPAQRKWIVCKVSECREWEPKSKWCTAIGLHHFWAQQATKKRGWARSNARRRCRWQHALHMKREPGVQETNKRSVKLISKELLIE